MARMFVKNGVFYPFDNMGDDLADIGYKQADGFDVDTLLAYPVVRGNISSLLALISCNLYSSSLFKSLILSFS